MPSDKLSKVPKGYGYCIKKYNWWWRMAYKQRHAIDACKNLGEFAYLYELYKRKHGIYFFEKSFNKLEWYKKAVLPTYLNREAPIDHDIGVLRSYYECRDILFDILLDHKKNKLYSFDFLHDLFEVLDERVNFMIEIYLKHTKGNWSPAFNYSFNLNRSKRDLLKAVDDWLNNQKEKWPQNNGQNAVKLLSRIEAYDLIKEEKITLASLPEHFRHIYKQVLYDYKNIDNYDCDRVPLFGPNAVRGIWVGLLVDGDGIRWWGRIKLLAD